MHKKLSLRVLAAAALAMAASAHAGVAVEADTSRQNFNGTGVHASEHRASVLADVKEGHKLGATVRHVDAFGAEANELSVRSVNKVSQSVTLDSEVTVGDSDVLTPKNRVSTLAKLQVRDNLHVGLGLGYSKYGFGADALTWKGVVGYKVPGLPLSVGADVQWSDDLYGLGSESRVGVDATYGTAGKWTVSGRLEDGNAQFSNRIEPVLENTRLSAEARYWVGKDWGVKAGVTHERNDFFKSNEVRAGVFFAL